MNELVYTSTGMLLDQWSEPIYYKVLDRDLSAPHGGKFQYEIGVWTPPISPTRMCSMGYHITTEPMAWRVYGMRVFEVDFAAMNPSGWKSDKRVCESIRLREEVTDRIVPKHWRELSAFVDDIASFLSSPTPETPIDQVNLGTNIIAVPDHPTSGYSHPMSEQYRAEREIDISARKATSMSCQQMSGPSIEAIANLASGGLTPLARMAISAKARMVQIQHSSWSRDFIGEAEKLFVNSGLSASYDLIRMGYMPLTVWPASHQITEIVDMRAEASPDATERMAITIVPYRHYRQGGNV